MSTSIEVAVLDDWRVGRMSEVMLETSIFILDSIDEDEQGHEDQQGDSLQTNRVSTSNSGLGYMSIGTKLRSDVFDHICCQPVVGW